MSFSAASLYAVLESCVPKGARGLDKAGMDVAPLGKTMTRERDHHAEAVFVI